MSKKTKMKLEKKVYLLYPPLSKQERFSSNISDAGGKEIPLGIFYLASYLRENGFKVKIADAEAEKLTKENIINEIKDFSPDFVGISSTTVAFHRTLEIAKFIKRKVKKIKIIVGGPHVTSNTDHAMSYNVFDYGVLKEGEITILELLNALYENKPINNIKGIAYKKNNKIIITPPREYINNLDILPFPAYNLIKNIKLYSPSPANYKSLPVINLITSRGCPYSCTFCDKNVFGQIYRERSAKNISMEIKYLWKNYNVKEIAFVDDIFLMNRKRIYDLFDILDKEKIEFNWSCKARVNNVDFEFLKFIKQKGCWRISFGIESGDKNILKGIKKHISLNQVEKVVNWCKKLKIKTTGFFIIGHPCETLETINKTINFSCKLRLHNAIFTINTPLPGSPQYNEIEKYGKIDKTNWSQFNYWRPVFIPKGLTKKILLQKHRESYRRFYWRPRIIFEFFLSFLGVGGFTRCKQPPV